MNNIMIGVLLSLLVLVGGLSYLSYSLSNDKALSEERYQDSLGRLKEANNALEIASKSCLITDSVNTEYQTEKYDQNKKADVVISKLDVLQTTSPKKANPIKEQVNNEASDIDSKLPASLVGLLNEACNPNKEGTCTPPGQPHD